MPYIFSPAVSRWIRLALAVVLCLTFPDLSQAGQKGMPRAQRHHSRDEIFKLEQAWRDALMQRNPQLLQGLLADDYIAITPNGSLESKQQTLEHLRSGALHFTSIEPFDRKVRFYGNTAVVTSRVQVVGNAGDGELTGSYRYTRVYVRDARGAWKAVSFEASRIRDNADNRKQTKD